MPKLLRGLALPIMAGPVSAIHVFTPFHPTALILRACGAGVSKDRPVLSGASFETVAARLPQDEDQGVVMKAWITTAKSVMMETMQEESRDA
jgi:hypothetical protein